VREEKVVRIEPFDDKGEALEAVGLGEQSAPDECNRWST
jgi:hypothetical protein